MKKSDIYDIIFIMFINCFEPVINAHCKVLILGSAPSVISRQVNFYYGNPSNRFWKILSAILDIDFTAMNNEKKAYELLRRRIALFDVFSSCEIVGSLDSNIKSAEFNDIPALIKNTDIKTIYVTSKKAYLDFVKRFGNYFESIGIKVISLPSTSSANRSKFKTDEDLLAEWKRLFTV